MTAHLSRRRKWRAAELHTARRGIHDPANISNMIHDKVETGETALEKRTWMVMSTYSG